MMSNQTDMIEIIKALSGQANILSIPRPYIDYMGSIDGGLFLSQLIYWSDRGNDPDGWFFKTYDEWEQELTLSKYEISKQSKILKKRGVLKTKVKKAKGSPTVHYKFLFVEFQKSFVEFLHYRKLKNFTIESKETLHSLTETTTETTTETLTAGAANEISVRKEKPDTNGQATIIYTPPPIVFDFDKEPKTPEEIDTYLRQAGYDPDEVGKRMKAAADQAIEKVKNEFEDHFGPNPRQDEIDAHQKHPRLSKDELLLHSLGAGVPQPIRALVAQMRDNRWNIRDGEIEKGIATFADVTGFPLPSTKRECKQWETGVRQHLDDEMFRGRLDRLYKLAWEKLEPQVRENGLTITHPMALTTTMKGIVLAKRPANSNGKINQADLLAYLQKRNIIEIKSKGNATAGYFWTDGSEVTSMPRKYIEMYQNQI